MADAPPKSVIPDPSVYLEKEAILKRAYDEAMAAIATKKQFLQHQYGLLANGQIDPNDPHGLIQSMKYAQAQQSMAAADSSEERGLGSGAGFGQSIESGLKFGQDQQGADLGNQFTSSMFDLSQAALQEQDNYDLAKWQAEQDAANAAIANGNFDPTPPVGPPPGDPTPPAPPPDPGPPWAPAGIPAPTPGTYGPGAKKLAKDLAKNYGTRQYGKGI